VKCTWPIYVLGFVGFAWGLAKIEFAALQSRLGLVQLVFETALVLVAVACLRRFLLRRNAALVFDEQPEPSIQTLGLN
jgi:hypothetical protein